RPQTAARIGVMGARQLKQTAHGAGAGGTGCDESRNFARVFSKEMKTTPAKFVERLRVEAARRRLEESQNSMETIAGECGFGNVNSMRTVFQRALKIAPGQYRRHFRSTHRAKRLTRRG